MAPVLFTASTMIWKPAWLMAFLSTNGSFRIASICFQHAFMAAHFAEFIHRCKHPRFFLSLLQYLLSFIAADEFAFNGSTVSMRSILSGLWLAVRMMPPSACRNTTAISTVGVVLRSRSITSIPSELSV